METYPKQITLPISGKIAIVERRLKGRDLRMADRAAGRNAEPMQRSYAMLAQVVSVGGQPVVMEDLDDMDLEDLNELFRALGLNAESEEDREKKSLMQSPSPNSSNGGSQQLN